MEDTNSRKTGSRWNIAWMGLAVLLLFLLAACGSSEPSGPVGVIAEEIADGVGRVMHVEEADTDKIVFVFEETHISPAGQVEISIMLNRLLERYGLRYVALEGAVLEDGRLDEAWPGPSAYSPGQPIGPREDVIVQLLEDGEISSAEMLALTYADVQVAGIELRDELIIELPEAEGDPTYSYLYEIAVVGLSDSEIREVNELIDQDKDDEAIDLIMGSDDFTDQMYDRLFRSTEGLSCEGLVNDIDEIEARAAEVSVEIDREDRDNLQGYRTFYQTCSDRSATMVENTLDLVQRPAAALVAMTTGAAHTDRIKELLRGADVAFAVIQAKSFGEDSRNGDLSTAAFERALAGSSVDSFGSPGALLDGRKKPPPVVGELWYQSKADLFFLTTRLARAARQGEPPPFDETLNDILPRLQSVTLLPETVQMVGNDVVFAVEAVDNNSRPTVIWVRARAEKDLAEMTLEERLFQGRANVQQKDAPSDKEPVASEAPVLEVVSTDTIAKFSHDQSAILSTTLGG